IVVVPLPQVPDTHEVATPVEDKAESVPTANTNATANPTPPGPTIQNIESTSLLLQGLTVVVSPDDGTLGHEPVAANPSPSKTTDSSGVSLPQPALNPNSASVVPATPVDSPTANKPVSRNGRAAPVHLVPVPLE